MCSNGIFHDSGWLTVTEHSDRHSGTTNAATSDAGTSDAEAADTTTEAASTGDSATEPVGPAVTLVYAEVNPLSQMS